MGSKLMHADGHNEYHSKFITLVCSISLIVELRDSKLRLSIRK